MTNDTRTSQQPGRQAGKRWPVLLLASGAVLAIAGGVLTLAMMATLRDQGTLDGRIDAPAQPMAHAVTQVDTIAVNRTQRLDMAPEEQPATF